MALSWPLKSAANSGQPAAASQDHAPPPPSETAAPAGDGAGGNGPPADAAPPGTTDPSPAADDATDGRFHLEAAADPTSSSPPPQSTLEAYRAAFLKQAAAASQTLSAGNGGGVGSASFPALNSQIVQAVEFSNDANTAAAPTIVAAPADAMISQAAGIASQASASYYDGMTKLVMASQAVMLKKLTEDLAANKPVQAAEEAAGIAVTELLLAGAMAVAAAGGALEAKSANFSIDQITKAAATLAKTKTG